MNRFDRIVFRDEEETESPQACEHNKAVLRAMAKYSPLSFWVLGIALLMFLLCVGTDIAQGHWVLPQVTPQTLLLYGANSSYKVFVSHQYWRVFSAMFLHGGVLHLLMNSTSFLLYLMPAEARLNRSSLFLGVLLWGGM